MGYGLLISKAPTHPTMSNKLVVLKSAPDGPATIKGPLEALQTYLKANPRLCVNVHIPSSVTKIGERAFWGCTGLLDVHIPGSVTKIGDGAFDTRNELTKIYIPSAILQNSRCHFYNGCLEKKTTMTYQMWKDVAKDMLIPRSVKEDCVNIILTLKMANKSSSLPPEMIDHILCQYDSGYVLLSK